MKKWMLLTLSALVLTGCVGSNIANTYPTAMSDQEIDRYSQEALIGEEALLGGKISTIQNSVEGARVELVRHELNTRGYPMEAHPIDGDRLVIRVKRNLSKNHYTPGDYLTAFGVVKSIEETTLGGKKLRVITIEAEDFSFWEDQRREFYRDRMPFNNNVGSYVGFGNYPRSGVGFSFGTSFGF